MYPNVCLDVRISVVSAQYSVKSRFFELVTLHHHTFEEGCYMISFSCLAADILDLKCATILQSHNRHWLHIQMQSFLPMPNQFSWLLVSLLDKVDNILNCLHTFAQPLLYWFFLSLNLFGLNGLFIFHFFE